MRIFLVGGIVLSTALLSVPAAAQDGAAVDMTGMGIYAMEDSVMEAAQGTVSRSNDKAPAAAKTAGLTYTPSITRRKANFAQFVAKTRTTDPEGAAKMEQLFQQTDVIEAMKAPLGELGLSTSNVADAYTAWWLAAWNAANGRTADPSPAQIAAVKAQAAQALSSQVASVSDAVKQEVAEANLVQAALIEAYVEQVAGDKAQLAKIAGAVRTGAQKSGLDLDKMNLTDQGFVAR